jgi:DNA invertase Pin-like site-specific DNA recombinase
MTELERNSAGDRPRRYGGDVRISDDEWVTDVRTGELRLSEKGITRQKEDILAKAGQIGAEVAEWYTENDTTAFKKKRIRLPNGRSVWRVYRPEFRRMLADYEDGKIDGIIFYDIDRLARQPRDLEDLIDLVEFYKRPVETVTGNIDLRTSNGRAMARVLVAMANKSSEDTSRRVARAWLQSAQEGRGNRWVGRRRRFGYQSDGTVNEAEAEVIRGGAKRFLAGGSWNSVVRFFGESGHPPLRAQRWTTVSVQQILLNPSTAGIAVYNGSLRQENQEGRTRYLGSDPVGTALRDAAGNYVMGQWPGVLAVKDWEAIVAESEGRRKGRVASAAGTQKYLLSGLLRCGCIREDGSMCNRSMSGCVQHRKSGPRYAYRCPSKEQGGCGGIDRNMTKLDQLIEDLLFAHLAANAPAAPDLSVVPDENDPDVLALADVHERLLNLRKGYAAVPRTVSDDTMFNVVPQLEASERELKARLARKARAQAGKLARSVSAEDVRREWDEAAGQVGVRRAILSRYLKAIIVRKSGRHGPGELDYESIEPVWREDGEVLAYDDIA